MKALKLGLGVVITGVMVALIYYYFESFVHGSLNAVWYDWFNTAGSRWLVVPLCLVGAFLFFGFQHILDPGSEAHESHGLGQEPSPTLLNLGKVLFIGYFSLVAGASLGPEAILVPACMIAGGYIGKKLFYDNRLVKLLSMAGFVALFAAFFHSFIAGLLGMLLVKKQTKLQLNPIIITVSVIASATTYFTLKLLDGSAYLKLPAYSYGISFEGALVLVLLAAAGFIAIMFLGNLHTVFLKLKQGLHKQNWVTRGLLAGIGLAILYLLGGTLVQFTGNESIVPMFEKAASLGYVGLFWILIVKLAAIGWSKAMGYRGGMIFPTIFVASVMIAIAQTAFHDVNFIYGLLAVLVGAFAADKRAQVLL